MIARTYGPAATLIACLLLVVTACGSDPVSDSTSRGPGPTPCPVIIPPDVVDGLGWDGDVAAAEGSGGCDWEGPEGLITVSSRADSLETACAELKRTPGDGYEATVEVPGSDADACAYFRSGDLGLSELVLSTDDGTVVGIEVAALAPTPTDDVEAALVALTERASEVP